MRVPTIIRIIVTTGYAVFSGIAIPQGVKMGVLAYPVWMAYAGVGVGLVILGVWALTGMGEDIEKARIRNYKAKVFGEEPK